jgi:hypothetical protein
MINNHTITILIDSGASHSYIDPRVVESLHLPRSNHGKSWLVQWLQEPKEKLLSWLCHVLGHEWTSTKDELNILPLGSYDCLIGMDWLDQAILDCRNKEFTCLDEEGEEISVDRRM